MVTWLSYGRNMWDFQVMTLKGVVKPSYHPFLLSAGRNAKTSYVSGNQIDQMNTLGERQRSWLLVPSGHKCSPGLSTRSLSKREISFYCVLAPLFLSLLAIAVYLTVELLQVIFAMLATYSKCQSGSHSPTPVPEALLHYSQPSPNYVHFPFVHSSWSSQNWRTSG